MRWQDIPANLASSNIQDWTMGPPMPPQSSQDFGRSLAMRLQSGVPLDYVSPQGKAWAAAHMPENIPLSPLPDPSTPGFVHPAAGYWQSSPTAANQASKTWVSQGPRWQENANGTWTFGPDPNTPSQSPDYANLPSHMQPPAPLPQPPGRTGPQLFPGPLSWGQ